MAYSTGNQANYGQRIQEYGYGLDDIERARNRVNRQDVLGQFNIGKKYQNVAREQGGQFNRRGMLDSGQFRRAKEISAGEQEMERFGLAGRTQEAQSQLDRQRFMLEENLSGGLQQDAIANALRRFVMNQSLQGLV
tara:strand:- start:3212 stop:3619 length:408 start_codon:yes stop_codon:yes gene_type:complete